MISDHIIALFGAKVLAYTKHDPSKLVIELEKIDEDRAVFIHTSAPGLTAAQGPGATCEARSLYSQLLSILPISNLPFHRIDSLYLDNVKSDQAYRLETYRSQGSISATASHQLRCYFVNKCNFPNPPPPSTREDGLVKLFLYFSLF